MGENGEWRDNSLPVKIISGRHNRSIEPGARLFLNRWREQSINTSRRALYCMGDAKRVPFTKRSRLFDILLNMTYLPPCRCINYMVGMASSQDSDLGSELNNSYA